jgi:hypothetical protein
VHGLGELVRIVLADDLALGIQQVAAAVALECLPAVVFARVFV